MSVIRVCCTNTGDFGLFTRYKLPPEPFHVLIFLQWGGYTWRACWSVGNSLCQFTAQFSVDFPAADGVMSTRSQPLTPAFAQI